MRGIICMSDSRDIQECSECQILIKKHGRNKLEECDFCSHLYYKKCDCNGAEEARQNGTDLEREEVEFT